MRILLERGLWVLFVVLSCTTVYVALYWTAPLGARDAAEAALADLCKAAPGCVRASTSLAYDLHAGRPVLTAEVRMRSRNRRTPVEPAIERALDTVAGAQPFYHRWVASELTYKAKVTYE